MLCFGIKSGNKKGDLSRLLFLIAMKLLHAILVLACARVNFDFVARRYKQRYRQFETAGDLGWFHDLA